MRSRIPVAVAALALLAAGCKEQGSGYVELRFAPSLQRPTVLLGGKEVSAARGGSVVVKRGVGTAKLEFERRKDERVSLCEVNVRKDRVTTVTLSPQGGTLRCAIELA